MVEKLSNTNSELGNNAEVLEKASETGRERLGEELKEKAEKASENNHDKLDLARQEALHEATEISPNEEEKAPVEEIETKQPKQESPTKKELDQNFESTMEDVRKDMSQASRTFSKIIHHPVVDKASDVVGKTIARPNLILAGALGTLILGSIVYFIAKRYGYVISGFEAIGTFILGWAIGGIVEFARVGFSNKKR